ncbi:MAG: flavodoxin family protein [Candidatus Eiseniibacteriota bacterium]|nr:MAG: flavodoxin family protein [Candidatus Eisenbacteria bacterium]
MRIATLLGSPRKKGNTATVLGLFEQLVAQDHEVDRMDIAFQNVKGCLGCYECQAVTDEPGCVQDDDAVSLFGRLIRSDAVVYATPLYCWCFPAQMKALIDRSLCLATGYGSKKHKSLMEGKKLALLVTCDGPVEDNADFIQGVFDRVCGFLKGVVVGKYIVPSCTTPGAVIDTGTAVARQMAKDIVGAPLG